MLKRAQTNRQFRSKDQRKKITQMRYNYATCTFSQLNRLSETIYMLRHAIHRLINGPNQQGFSRMHVLASIRRSLIHFNLKR